MLHEISRGPLKAKFDLDHGGVLCFLSWKGSRNLINQFKTPWGYDWGREMQTAIFIGGNIPGGRVEDTYVNPTQACGNMGMIKNPVQLATYDLYTLTVVIELLEYSSPWKPSWSEQKEEYYRTHNYPHTGWIGEIMYYLEEDAITMSWELWNPSRKKEKIQLFTGVCTLDRKPGMELINEHMRDESSWLDRTIKDDRMEIRIPDQDIIATVTVDPGLKLINPKGSETHDWFGCAGESPAPILSAGPLEGWVQLKLHTPEPHQMLVFR